MALASAIIGLRLPPDWPDMGDVLALRLEQLDRDPALQPWLLRAMALRSGVMIGHIGFHTSPGAQYLEPWRPRGSRVRLYRLCAVPSQRLRSRSGAGAHGLGPAGTRSEGLCPDHQPGQPPLPAARCRAGVLAHW